MTTRNDWLNELDLTREEALKEGREEGARDTTIAVAKKFLEKGLDPATVAECTGLSIEQIQSIQK